MLRRLGLICATLALFSIAGGHWAVLQTVAWAEMLRDYTQRSGSVALAVEQTFDGEHPCDLCLGIASAKRQEAKAQSDQDTSSSSQQSKAAKADKDYKALPLANWQIAAKFAVGNSHLYEAQPVFVVSRDERPPTPPPRFAVMA